MTAQTLVDFAKYLLHEESIQGSLDDEPLLLEYANEFLARRDTRLRHPNPKAVCERPQCGLFLEDHHTPERMPWAAPPAAAMGCTGFWQR